MTPDNSIDTDVEIVSLKPGAPINGGAIDVLLQVKAPPWDPVREASYGGTRPSLRLALVVDYSAGMAGDPFSDALRCVLHIVSHLRPDDQVALVLFDSQVETAVSLRAADKVEAINAALVGVGVETGGGSALVAAWEAGARQLAQTPWPGTSRVLLFTSGKSDLTPAGTSTLAEELAQWRSRGVTTTTVFLGSRSDEAPMQALSKSGGGQHYEGYRAADLCEGFDQELGLFRMAYLSYLNLNLSAAHGVAIEVLGKTQSNGRYVCNLPDLHYGTMASLLVRLHVSADDDPTRSLLTVKLRGNTLDHMTTVMQSWPTILVRLETADLDELPINGEVAASLLEHQYGEIATRARAMVRSGEAAEALAMLCQMDAALAGHPWLEEALAHLKERARHTSTLMDQAPSASQPPSNSAASGLNNSGASL